MTAVYLCECKHAKGVHQGMTYWCREPGCTCKRYTPDFAAAAPLTVAERAISATAQVISAAYGAALVEVPITETPFGGESTSARLRRVEQERDELAAHAEVLARGLTDAVAERELARAELASARAELERLRNRGGVIAQHVRYLCETCGSRYGQPYPDHAHGPLTPVVVTITRQGGQDG